MDGTRIALDVQLNPVRRPAGPIITVSATGNRSAELPQVRPAGRQRRVNLDESRPVQVAVGEQHPLRFYHEVIVEFAEGFETSMHAPLIARPPVSSAAGRPRD